MKQMTVRELKNILDYGLSKKHFTLDTKIMLTDDDEVNGVHACYGWSTITKEEIIKYYDIQWVEDKEYFLIG